MKDTTLSSFPVRHLSLSGYVAASEVLLGFQDNNVRCGTDVVQVGSYLSVLPTEVLVAGAGMFGALPNRH